MSLSHEEKKQWVKKKEKKWEEKHHVYFKQVESVEEVCDFWN